MNGFWVRKPTPLIKGSRLGRDPGLQVQTDCVSSLVPAELLTWIVVKHVFPQHRPTFETGHSSEASRPKPDMRLQSNKFCPASYLQLLESQMTPTCI